MIDGTIARKTKSISGLGARLDSVADSVFVASLSAIDEVYHTRMGKEVF